MNNNKVTIDQPLPLFATVCFSAVAILIFNVLPVFMGVISDTLALTAEQLGLLASLELGGIGLTSVTGLFWIRRLRWRGVVLFGALVTIAGDLLSIFADSAVTLITLRFITGFLGEGVIFTVAVAAIGDSHNSDRAFAYAIVGQVGLGMIGLLCFPYIAHSMGFAGIMVTMALLVLVCLVLLPWLPPGGEKGGETDELKIDSGSAGSMLTTIIGLAGLVCWFVGLSGIWVFTERIGTLVPLPQTTIGTLLSLGLGLGAIAALGVALIGDRYGRFWPLLTAVSLHVLVCFLFAGSLTAYLYGALILSFTFIWNIGLPFLMGLIADSDSNGRVVVLLVSAQALGNTLGPIIAGKVIAFSGLQSVGISSAIFCALTLVVVAFFCFRLKRLFAQQLVTGAL